MLKIPVVTATENLLCEAVELDHLTSKPGLEHSEIYVKISISRRATKCTAKKMENFERSLAKSYMTNGFLVSD
jgi:hypothetical protein